MTDSETEAETIERLEVALRKIAAARILKRPPSLDRDALARSLDLIILRLRAGLKTTPRTQPVTE